MDVSVDDAKEYVKEYGSTQDDVATMFPKKQDSKLQESMTEN